MYLPVPFLFFLVSFSYLPPIPVLDPDLTPHLGGFHVDDLCAIIGVDVAGEVSFRVGLGGGFILAEDDMLVGAAQAGGQPAVQDTEDDEGAHSPEPEEYGEATGEE